MKKHGLRVGAALCACVLWMMGAAAAEEKRMGDYIYVPAMAQPGSVGVVSLRVEGLAYAPQTDTQTRVSSLAGAEFGVYVISSAGEVTPWANPLFPSEPMRIRTGEGETRFTLPQGTEFYLRQERAPEGYLFDSEVLIPVVGEELVVTNAMAGQLAVRVRDSAGVPLAGVALVATDEAGQRYPLTTDEAGQAVLPVAQAQTYTLVEQASGDVTPLLTVQTDAGETAQPVAASVALADRTEVTFVHAARGTVALQVTRAALGDNGQTQTTPLAGVEMTVQTVPPLVLISDEAGQAQADLLEGTYAITLRYAGQEDAVLPAGEGQLIVRGGETTPVQLTASSRMGRVAMTVLSNSPLDDGEIILQNVQSGVAYGPYLLDAQGRALTQPLPAGQYTLTLRAPDNAVIAAMASEGQTADEQDELRVTVRAGELTQAQAEVRTRVIRTFALVAQTVDEAGEPAEMLLCEPMRVELIDEQDAVIATAQAQDGAVRLEALSGTYRLRLSAQDAQMLGVQTVSEPFALPGVAEAVYFADSAARLILTSVAPDGAPISGAVYRVTDSAGMQVEVTCDEAGEAVTPPLSAGAVTVETLFAPSAHDVAATQTAQATMGEMTRVTLTHPRYGTASLQSVRQSVNARGEEVYAALPGVRVTLYAVEPGTQQLTETGLMLTTAEDGTAEVSLAPGEYETAVAANSVPQGCSAPQPVRFTVENDSAQVVALPCKDALSGIRVRLIGEPLTDEALAQVRFALVDASGEAVTLKAQGDGFAASGLAAGDYVLRQTQMPEGYALAAERAVHLTGGEAAQVDVPLEEYAVLTVAKTGLTLNAQMQTFVVPLTGAYGVYTQVDGALVPYPSQEEQAVVWANAAPDKPAQVKLPADMEGTTYYLLEQEASAGFTPDTQAHAVTLYAGQNMQAAYSVACDRGFFALETVDAQTGAHVSGSRYALLDGAGETVLTLTVAEEPYQHDMALPVGTYTLRQLEAAPGYALSLTPEMAVTVQPYLTQGGSVTQVTLPATALPTDAQTGALLADVYVAHEQGLTLVCVEGGALPVEQSLDAAAMTVDLRRADGGRLNIASVVLAGATDAQGGAYRARVEYCLSAGGWQPSDARLTDVLTEAQALSLLDVQDDICALRITYLHAETGEESVAGGFTPGMVTLNVQVDAQGETALLAETRLDGVYRYRTAFGGALLTMQRTAQQTVNFTALGGGMFERACAGRDGRISGVAFLDEDADGLLDAQEKGRYAALGVALLTPSGETVATTRTAADGSYAFEDISSGDYVVQFTAGDQLVFTSGALYSPHVVSGVRDVYYGTSETLSIDGDHTDFLINAGCVYAASVSGQVLAVNEAGAPTGVGGLPIELSFAEEDEQEDEPIVVVTDDAGSYHFGSLLPGAYAVRVALPQGYLCAQAEAGVVHYAAALTQGDTLDLGATVMYPAASLSGAVRVDADGDGTVDAGAQTLEGVRVALLRSEDGQTTRVAETQTDAQGGYRFDGLEAGTYSVLFTLEGDWTFTRFGADSAVYGAVSQSGSTQEITLDVGESVGDINAGVTLPAQLTVTVFADAQADGRMGAYEEGLEGAAVTLIRQEGGGDAEEVTLHTDAEGRAVFTSVSPGAYVIGYQLPGHWRATRQPQAAGSAPASCVPESTLPTGRSAAFTLSMGQSDARYIGARLSGTIAGIAFDDADGNGNQDERETPLAGVYVALLGADDAVLTETQTAQDGSYAFEGLASGRYRVRFTAPQGCCFSGTERTAARGAAQQSETNVSLSRVITVTGGTAHTTAHAGVVRLCEVKGYVWVDSDADGERGEQEVPLAGVSVHLMNGEGRSILASTQTDATGAFAFAGRLPGDYLLRVDAPEGYVFSSAARSSALSLQEERDGRGYSSPFTLRGGAKVEGLGFGLLTQASIAGQLWQDANYDGRLTQGEDGLRGASVVLLDGMGAQVAETQTLRDGSFTFKGLMPGAYALRVTLPEGYVFTAEGGDSLAPRLNGTTVTVALGELSMGEQRTGVRMGALKPAQVGGMVWLDADNDGRRRVGDASARAKVTLTMCSGADAGLQMETVTDDAGSYRFDGVMPGMAQLTFTLADGCAFAVNANGTQRVSVVPQADAQTAQTEAFAVASGEALLTMDAGVVHVGVITGTVWEDSQYDGKRAQTERGVADAHIALLDAATGNVLRETTTDEQGAYALDFVRVGEYQVQVTLPEGMLLTKEGVFPQVDASQAVTARFALAMGESRHGVDAGAIVPAVIDGQLTLTQGKGDLSGAVVTVLQGGTVVANTRAQADGRFALVGLRPGAYRVRVALPRDMLFALDTNLTVASTRAQEGETAEITLTMGQRQTLAPIAVVKAGVISGAAWADANVNGLPDAGEAPLTGVVITLLDANGMPIDQAVTDAQGQYAFGLLREGDYAVRFILPHGQLFADAVGQPGGSCVEPIPGQVAQTPLFALAAGETRAQMNVGAIEPGAIGDTVWRDRNGNGLQDYKEPCLAGVSLTLLRVLPDGQMQEVAQTESDAYGYYAFKALRPGVYALRVNTQPGDVLTAHFGEPLGEIDSDIDPDTGMSAPFTLASGQTLRNIDVGLIERGE